MSQLEAEPKRVALLGFDPDVEGLLAEVLKADGYFVSTFPPDVTSADQLARASSHLLLLSTGVGTGPVHLLDSLRQHAQTAALPVIVLATTEAIQEQAHASGNVFATISLPFDIDELLDGVRNALSGTSFERRVQALPLEREPAFAQAADVLARTQRELMLMWVQQIRLVDPLRERSDFSTREFLDNLPRLLYALIALLRRASPPDVLARDSDVQARARAHARMRLAAGLAADAVLREYQVLRDVITRHLQHHLPAEALITVLEDINWLLDDVERITVAEYISMLEQGRE